MKDKTLSKEALQTITDALTCQKNANAAEINSLNGPNAGPWHENASKLRSLVRVELRLQRAIDEIKELN